MRREEFMKELEYRLRVIPAMEREDALAYYENYFDEAGPENESQVIQELGSPEAVAEKIIGDTQHTGAQQTSEPKAETSKEEKKQGLSKEVKILIAVIAVLTFPLWIGIVAGIFGTVIGILGAAVGVAFALVAASIGFLVGGILLIIRGIIQIALNPAGGMICIGLGALLTALGIGLAVLCIWCLVAWIPKAVKKLISWIKNLINRMKGGNKT